MRAFFRLRIENRPRLSGGYVLAANHCSLLDPLLLGAASTRRITWLMTETFWRAPALNWFFRWNKAIPVAPRGGNRDALRAARSVLQQGRVLGIFPEGGLSRDGLPLLGNPGAVSLVFGESVPIVPVGLLGTGDALPIGRAWPRPRRVTIRFGEPIAHADLERLGQDRKTRLAAATETIMERIAALVGVRSRESELRLLRAARAAHAARTNGAAGPATGREPDRSRLRTDG